LSTFEGMMRTTPLTWLHYWSWITWDLSHQCHTKTPSTWINFWERF